MHLRKSEYMPKLTKADKQAKISANEARRRKEVALARLREMEADEKAGQGCGGGPGGLVAGDLVNLAAVRRKPACGTFRGGG